MTIFATALILLFTGCPPQSLAPQSCQFVQGFENADDAVATARHYEVGHYYIMSVEDDTILTGLVRSQTDGKKENHQENEQEETIF